MKSETCTKTGIRTCICSKYMSTWMKVIPKDNSHTWKDWKPTTAATVSPAGMIDKYFILRDDSFRDADKSL